MHEEEKPGRRKLVCLCEVCLRRRHVTALDILNCYVFGPRGKFLKAFKIFAKIMVAIATKFRGAEIQRFSSFSHTHFRPGKASHPEEKAEVEPKTLRHWSEKRRRREQGTSFLMKFYFVSVGSKAISHEILSR